MVNGKQLTIMWHVDDLKVSHADVKVVDEFIEWLKETYEEPEIKKIKPSRGKVHNYLGITLDFTMPGVVRLYMKDYIKKMIEGFEYRSELDAMRIPQTPAAEHLFSVNPKAKPLSEEKRTAFHHTTAQALFLCKRTRPDIQPTVPFLCTRVKTADVDDWKKLLRMLKYLDDTADLELRLQADEGDILVLQFYPDGSHAVHADMKGHTGSAMTLGKGSAINVSSKQKLNTKSSTETELVAADDVLDVALWATNFLKAQGYKCDVTVYQDNTSAILLEKNGQESQSKRT